MSTLLFVSLSSLAAEPDQGATPHPAKDLVAWSLEWEVGRHAGLVEAPFEGTLELLPVGPSASVAPRPIQGETPIVLEVPAGQDWRLRLVAEGWWMAEEVLEAEAPRAARSRRLAVLPSSRLKIRALERTEAGGVPLTFLSIRVESGPAGGTEIECEPSAKVGNFSCVVPVDPSGETSFSVRPTGYMPLYWDLALPPQSQRQLGSLYLVAGASIAGQIRGANGRQISTATLQFGLERQVDNGEGHVHTEVLSSLAPRFGAGGFFQLSQLFPGRYRLRIQGTGFEPLASDWVEVEAGQETLLADVLVVMPLPESLESPE